MSDSRPRGGARQNHAASLRCGLVLTYEAPTFLAQVREVVPCRRHGYCAVDHRDQTDGRSHGGERRRSGRRSQEELTAFLSRFPVTTVNVLRKQRFSLRQVDAVQQSGLVDVDLQTGKVCLRASTSRDSAPGAERRTGWSYPVMAGELEPSVCDPHAQPARS